jgi:multidrug efflux pump subunit AcrB
MNVSAWCIRNPIPAILLFVLLTLVGLMGWQRMAVQHFPDIDLPTVTVTAALPGAAPAQLETEVARRIENAVATIDGVRHIYSRVQDGAATVTVEFRIEKPTQEAVDDVRDAISRIRADLPADLREPVISRMEITGAPILTFTVASDRKDEEALSWFVDDQVTRAMLAVPGVGRVARVGGVDREVRVELDPARLLALGATAAEISRQLRAVQQEASGGRVDLGGAEQTVRTLATVASAEELAQMQIALAHGRRIRLADVATVTDTVAERRSAALLDGRPVVGFEITRSRGAGEVGVAAGVRAAVEQMRAEHPGVSFTEAFNFVDPVQYDYDASITKLFIAAFLAVVVVWFFLRDWRATLVAATALPLSIVPTFGLMWLLGYSINVVTLLALTMVVGILVDDAIVEIENITRHLRMPSAGPPQAGQPPSGGGQSAAMPWGPSTLKTPLQAAREAADEIGLAVIATTFTLIAVFLPTAFMGGVPGKFFVQFGWTAAIAVFFSLVVARMLTPMMAAYLLHAPKQEYAEPRWLGAYVGWAGWCLRHRALTLLGAAAFFFGSFALVPLLPTGFIPPDDQSQTQVRVELPPGSTFAQTLAMAERARAIVDRHPHVRLVYTTVGGGATGADPFMPGGLPEVRQATLTVNISPRGERRGIRKQQVEAELREALAELPGVRVAVGLAGATARYVLVLASEDGRVLAEHARKVEQELRTIPGIGAVTSSATLTRPELVVRPDAARAADLGVTTAAIADTLRIATAGDYSHALPQLNLGQRQVPVVVRLPADARTDLDLLARLHVPGARGPVVLGSVASLSLESGPALISRFDRQRNINFEVELDQLPLGEVEARVLALPSLQNLPPGVFQTTVGDADAMNELFASFGLAMAIGVLCIYFVLVLLFRDFVQPGTILVALVLSVPGAFLALYLAGMAISLPSMIGLIMLMGIATKNSILLVDYIVIARRDHGLGRIESVLDGCRKRARPIVMTTIAMCAGMLPIAIGIGMDPSFRAPMAVVVIGGLITSTFLSLLVVPVVYTLVDDAKRALRRRLARPAVAVEGQPEARTAA